jgi:hypothetical protein
MVDFIPYQEISDRYPQIAREDLAAVAHLVEPDGRISRGAQAVFRMFALAGRKRRYDWAYRHVPGFAASSEAAYHFVARHRPIFSRFAACSADPASDPRGINLTCWLFLRALGLIYLFAFASLRPQIIGLVGGNGILPAQNFLDRVSAQLGAGRFWQLPTLCWYSSSDTFLQLLCTGGIVVACLLILDIAPALMLVLLWGLYLSLTHVGQVFLQFQWDALLLETGLLAIFLAPMYLLPRPGRAPTPRP